METTAELSMSDYWLDLKNEKKKNHILYLFQSIVFCLRPNSIDLNKTAYIVQLDLEITQSYWDQVVCLSLLQVNREGFDSLKGKSRVEL